MHYNIYIGQDCSKEPHLKKLQKLAAWLQAHGAGASALDVVARPKADRAYDDALVARYLKLEDDCRAGKI